MKSPLLSVSSRLWRMILGKSAVLLLGLRACGTLMTLSRQIPVISFLCHACDSSGNIFISCPLDFDLALLWRKQVQQLTQIATPLLNTFLQGILGNPVARQALQDLTVTPNLELFLQGLQNLTQITQPPIVSLLVRYYPERKQLLSA